MTIYEYLRENDIYVVGNRFKSGFKEDVNVQVQIVAYIHRVLMSYPDMGGGNILSELGKKVEEYKCLYKRFTRFLKNSSEENEVDMFLIDSRENILGRAEHFFSEFNEKNYLSLINRSMVRSEITLGRVESGNLRVLERVEIGNLNKISYNLVEEDLIEYILKLRKRGYIFDEDLLINRFINISRLDHSSGEYIKNMLVFPIETLKAFDKYIFRKKGLSDSEYLMELQGAYKREFERGKFSE